MKARILLLLVALGGGFSARGVERWGVFEVTLPGPVMANPYLDVQVSATFSQGDQRITVPGFWDMFWNMSGSDPKHADLAWINTNIRQGHGPLGAVYPRSGFNPGNPGQQEGDTPSFLHLVRAVRALNDPDKPDQAGWGRRFLRRDPSRNHWGDDPAGGETVWRWRAEVQQNFARRADWMIP